MIDYDKYMYTDLSDDYIISVVYDRRKLTLKQDLRRHVFLIIRIYLGIAKHATKDDLPGLYEWVLRLQSIINKQKKEAKNA